MNPLAELTASFTGWAAIIAGRPDAASHFRTDAAGVAFAAMTFLVAVLLSVAAQSAAVGMPSAGQLLFGLIAQGLTTVLLGLAMAWALKFLRLDVPLAKSRCSSNPTLSPRVTASSATPVPTMPPPKMPNRSTMRSLRSTKGTTPGLKTT